MSAASQLAQIKQQYTFTLAKCHEIRKGMMEDMTIGLQSNGKNSSCKMLPSRVKHLPNGNENGIYYAIDWGGSNVRFIRVKLTPNKQPIIDSIKHKIPQSLQTTNDVNNLFNFLAVEFKKLMFKYNEDTHNNMTPYPVGFTFSFPINQPSLDSGILLQWTKGFNIPNVVGKDIVILMNNAFNRYNVPARVNAICNDTVGTLISCSYSHRNTMIGIIIGTGTNAAYVEPNRNNEVINIEWGNFDQNKKYLPRVQSSDVYMDKYTVNTDAYLSEKMLSGLYIGEISRLIVNQLFGNKIPNDSILKQSFTEFTGYNITIILKIYYKYKNDDGISEILKLLKNDKYNLQLFNENDVKVMVNVFIMITNRSADLSACLLCGVLQKIGFYKENIGCDDHDQRFVLADKYIHDYITVGIDGGVFLNMPQYPQRMRKTMVNLVGESIVNRIHIHHAEDGSGRGAALCVASNSNNNPINSKL